MRLPRVRFSIGWAMVWVALLALGLASATATWRAWPRRIHPAAIGNGRGATWYVADGRAYSSRGYPKKGFQDGRLVRPPRPSLPRVCSPVVAAAAITLLVLVLATRRPRGRRVRGLVLVLLVGASTIALRWWWVLYGGTLPVHRLRLDMTKQEVRAIVGPPNPEGSDEDRWLITRPGSLFWMEIEFDHEGRLRAYPPGGHGVDPRRSSWKARD